MAIKMKINNPEKFDNYIALKFGETPNSFGKRVGINAS